MLIAGHRVEGIGLGTAQFAFRDGTAGDCVATVHAALDAGVRLIDTALAYTRASAESYAERVIARALRGVSERPLIATKGGHWRRGDVFPVDARPETLRAHCDIRLAVAMARGVSVQRVMLGWLRAQSPNIVPLAGASRPASIRDSAALLDLGDQDLAGLRA